MYESCGTNSISNNLYAMFLLSEMFISNITVPFPIACTEYSSPTVTCNNILKFEDKILIGNIMFVSESINNLLPPIFNNCFIFCSETHGYNTVLSSTDKLIKPSYRAHSYGKNSVVISAINCWNKTQSILDCQSLKSLYPSKIKNILKKKMHQQIPIFLKKY